MPICEKCNEDYFDAIGNDHGCELFKVFERSFGEAKPTLGDFEDSFPDVVWCVGACVAAEKFIENLNDCGDYVGLSTMVDVMGQDKVIRTFYVDCQQSVEYCSSEVSNEKS